MIAERAIKIVVMTVIVVGLEIIVEIVATVVEKCIKTALTGLAKVNVITDNTSKTAKNMISNNGSNPHPQCYKPSAPRTELEGQLSHQKLLG